MTVAELISQLQELPQNMTVVVNLTKNELANGKPVKEAKTTLVVTNNDVDYYEYQGWKEESESLEFVVNISS